MATTCPHCATGCQFNLVVKDNEIVNVEALNGPSNHKRLCVKGRSGSFEFVGAEDRLTDPLIRDRVTGEFRKVSREEAISYTAKRFMEIREQYGGDALAGFACSRSPNEDIYMVQKMVRTCFGTNNTDNCARVCHSATMTIRTPGLNLLAGEGFIEVNFRDAERLGIGKGERIRVSSRRGTITATAHVGRKVSQGETWMPFHFPDSPVNMLTNAALDEFARIPEYKVCAVRLEKIAEDSREKADGMEG